MSSNEPPLEVQRRRHAGPLIGIAVILIIVGAAFVWWMGYEVEEGTQPEGSAVQIDGRTGEETLAPPPVETPEDAPIIPDAGPIDPAPNPIRADQAGGADGAILDAGASDLQPTREDEIAPTTPAPPEGSPALETTP